MKKPLTLLALTAFITYNTFGQTKNIYVANTHRTPSALNVNNKLQPGDTTIYSNFLPCDSFIYIYSLGANKGWAEGSNYLLQTDEAEYYAFGDNGITGESIGVEFIWGDVHHKTATDKVTFSLIKADGPNGSPGTVLATKQVNIADLDTTFGAINTVLWSTPILNPGNCFMAITLPIYSGGHFNSKSTVSLFQSTWGVGFDPGCPHDSLQGTGWCKYNGIWYNYGTFWTGVGTSNGYASLSLYALFTQSSAGCGPISVAPSAPSICNKKSVTLNASGANVTSFTWSPSTGLNKTTGAAVTAKPTTTTTYTVSGNGGLCSTTVMVTVLNTPSVTVSAGNCTNHAVLLTATASSGGDPLKYQWKLGGTSISGATKSTFSATVSGSYTCLVTDKTTSCKTTSAAKSVTVSCRLAESGGAFDANAYPNPFTQALTINISSNLSDAATVELMDFSGRTLKVYNNVEAGSPFVINENLSSGVYFVRVTEGESTRMIKVVKN